MKSNIDIILKNYNEKNKENLNLLFIKDNLIHLSDEYNSCTWF